MEGLTAPWPHLRVSPRVSPPTWECICARGDSLGANSCPQTSSHSLWERIYLPLVPCTRLPWAWPSSWVVSIPRASLGGRGTSQVRLLYTGAITMALKPPFSSLYYYPGLSGFEALPRRRSLRGLSYPWVSGSDIVIALLLWHLALATPYLGDALTWRCLRLGDALPWRHFLSTTPCLGDACT